MKIEKQSVTQRKRQVSASACGKVILFGEHAVVYGRPAIAAPVTQVRAAATIRATRIDTVMIEAADITRCYQLRHAEPDDPLAAIIRLTCEKLAVLTHSFSVTVRSTIPVARGFGSGAAVSIAIARALGQYFSNDLTQEEISALAYEVEKLHHGTPSGIDNTVIALERPIYFVKGQAPEPFRVARPFLIAIADTGIASPTKIAVGDVRWGWERARERYEGIFDQVGEIALQARRVIESGETSSLGSLMLKNQELLREIGVSTGEIESLVDAAVGAGAEGAKLSGAGRGGNVIALVDDDSREYVERAMRRAGARGVIVTKVG